MAHLLTISDIILERKRLLNSMELLPLSTRFTEQEKEDLKVIYQDTLEIYNNAIERKIDNYIKTLEVKDFELQPTNEK